MAGPTKEFEVHPYVQFMMDKYSPVSYTHLTLPTIYSV